MKPIIKFFKKTKVILLCVLGIMALLYVASIMSAAYVDQASWIIAPLYNTIQSNKLLLLLFHILGFGAIFWLGYRSIKKHVNQQSLSEKNLQAIRILIVLMLLTIIMMDWLIWFY